MAWEVEYTDEFEQWWLSVSTCRKLRELRIQHKRRALRVVYAFALAEPEYF